MKSNVEPRSHLLGKVLAPLAFAVALAPCLTTQAIADDGVSITGKVTAAPAKYLADTVVYVKAAPGTHKGGTVLVDQKAMQFIPHVATATVGDTITFANHDSVSHNVFSPDNEGFNLGTFPPSETRTYAVRKPNVAYSELCSMHPEMLGYLFVGQNPYHAVVDAGGNFTIKGVPAGSYAVAVWNPKLKAAEQNVTVAAGAPATVSFALAR